MVSELFIGMLEVIGILVRGEDVRS